MSVTDILNQLTPDGAHLTPAPVQLRASGEFNGTCDRVLKCLPALFRMLVASGGAAVDRAVPLYTSKVGRVQCFHGPAPNGPGNMGARGAARHTFVGL